MPSEGNFLQAIIADPDNDDLRLVFSDWLEENGHVDRAEFIRKQILQARHPWCAQSLRNTIFGTSRLFAPMSRPWALNIPEFPYQYYRRGLVDCVGNDCDKDPFLQVLQAAEKVFSLTPLRSVYFELSENDEILLSRWSKLNSLQGLALDCYGVESIQYEVLLNSQYLSNITELELHHCELNDEILLTSPIFPKLRKLIIEDCWVKGDFPLSLFEFAQISKLRELQLGSYSYSDDMKRLAESKLFKGLEQLHLTRHSIGDEGLTTLVESPNLRNIRILNTKYAFAYPRKTENITVCGIESLVHSKNTTNLTGLCFYGDQIGDEGAVLLANWNGLSNIWYLSLINCEIGDRGALALAESPYLQPQSYLNLSSNVLSEKTVQTLRDKLGDYLLWKAPLVPRKNK